MKTYIALLRGINVGGHRKVPMAELREVLSKCGLEQVKTYIQSGNVIFRSSKEDLKVLEQLIQSAILNQFGFEVPVLIRTPKSLKLVLETCPFEHEKKENSYFILLSDIPKKELVNEVSEIQFENEAFVIIKDCLYFHSSVGYGRTKFNMNSMEKKLKVQATSRNYKTMLKLIAMSNDLV
ncbi:MAG: DUF1697 domain-containing protein [Psychroserpens sp.]|nr:DUF1697 domain-containing protein [Psychroserpens sp.]